MSDYKDAAAKLHGLLNGAAESAERAMAPAKPVQATVSNVTAEGVYVKTDGDDTAKGPFPATIKAVIGDRVGIAQVGGTWTVNDNFTNPAADQETVDEAWTKANSAQVAAETASGAASAAQASATAASTAAATADAKAVQAGTAAASAQSSADAAASAAAVADGKAVQAASAAATADQKASQASAAAATADAKAEQAGVAAAQANTYALGALNGLSTVEDVLGTINWITNHATFAPTTDSAIDPSKVYYVADQTSPYGYAVVAEPDVSEISTYYEMTMDAALANYVASHLALTNDGLFLIKDGSGYRLKLDNSGWYIIDPQGTVVISGRVDTLTGARHVIVGTPYSDIDLNPSFGDSQDGGVYVYKGSAVAVLLGLDNGTPALHLGQNTRLFDGSINVGGHFVVDRYDTVDDQGRSANLPAYTLGGRGTGGVGGFSVSEGAATVASGYSSHAEGIQSEASGIGSHAEGTASASDYYAHAEGAYSVASGHSSHAEGDHTLASSDYQHVQGKYNVADSNGTYAHIVGNGTANDARSNAHTLDWNGNAWFAGGVTGTSISDGTGTLAQLRESVSHQTLDLVECNGLHTTFAATLATRYQGDNRGTLIALGFYNNPSDNPFTFAFGYALAVKMPYITNRRYYLIGWNGASVQTGTVDNSA